LTAPEVVHTVADLAAARAAMSGRVAVVMTMGALHPGHATLIRAAHEVADAVLVTIFVNPLQFAAGEDLDRYPRTLPHDLEICAAEGVDVVFAPSVDDVYPPGETVPSVVAGELGSVLEGAFRPGHFDGVLTVVSRLMTLTRPDVALYGEKDAQQLALIRRMAVELHPELEVRGEPTVREPDGLALSSRNRYLGPDERLAALAISRGLRAGIELVDEGPAAMIGATRQALAAEPALSVDYAEIIDADSWQEPGPETSNLQIVVAARAGGTRLIDNMSVRLGTRP
jgi:pantoate--beta-alanine ligase